MKKYLEQLVVSEPNWCVPATLEMVLKHHGIDTFSQHEIAKQLDIVSASDEVEHKRWGAQIKENTLNDFFVANMIPLHEEFIPIWHFMDDYFMAEKIQELLKSNISIVCGYNYTWLYGNKEDTFQHVSIIVNVLLQNDQICLLDPGPKNAGYKTVKSEDLFYAIRAARDGLWCIQPLPKDSAKDL